MADFGALSTGLAFLQEEIDGDDVPSVGTVIGDAGNIPGGLASIQAAIVAGTTTSDDRVDFSALYGGLQKLRSEITGGGGGDRIFFGDDPIFFGADPIIYTPLEE